jgi:hypothetical protein
VVKLAPAPYVFHSCHAKITFQNGKDQKKLYSFEILTTTIQADNPNFYVEDKKQAERLNMAKRNNQVGGTILHPYHLNSFSDFSQNFQCMLFVCYENIFCCFSKGAANQPINRSYPRYRSLQSEQSNGYKQPKFHSLTSSSGSGSCGSNSGESNASTTSSLSGASNFFLGKFLGTSTTTGEIEPANYGFDNG